MIIGIGAIDHFVPRGCRKTPVLTHTQL